MAQTPSPSAPIVRRIWGGLAHPHRASPAHVQVRCCRRRARSRQHRPPWLNDCQAEIGRAGKHKAECRQHPWEMPCSARPLEKPKTMTAGRLARASTNTLPPGPWVWKEGPNGPHTTAISDRRIVRARCSKFLRPSALARRRPPRGRCRGASYRFILARRCGHILSNRVALIALFSPGIPGRGQGRSADHAVISKRRPSLPSEPSELSGLCPPWVSTPFGPRIWRGARWPDLRRDAVTGPRGW